MSFESHPPAPPGCAYFANALSDGKLHFLPTASLGNGSVCVESLATTWGRVANAGPGRSAVVAPAMRGLIAAVARCAWLDEEPRRMEELGVEEDLDGGLYWKHRPHPIGEPESDEELDAELKIFEEGNAEEQRRIALVRECRTNANAWSKWGRGEEYNA